jgi:hypothetical protein
MVLHSTHASIQLGMSSVRLLSWIWCLGISVAAGLLVLCMINVWRIFTLIMLLLTAILIMFPTWIWCSGSVLLLGLVVVLLGIIVVLFASAAHWAGLIAGATVFAVIWALNMVGFHPAKLMLQEIIITTLLNSLEILKTVLFTIYLILIPYDLAHRERLSTIFGPIILILLPLFVFLSISVANVKDFLHRFWYGKAT